LRTVNYFRIALDRTRITAGIRLFSQRRPSVCSVYSLQAGSVPALADGDDVRKPVAGLWRSSVVISCGLLLIVSLSFAQQDSEPGHSIGNVSINGDLIILQLNDGALGKANLFDLTGHTL